uniref:Transmembrane protein 230 n=1 Tax=Octopus bimaculoides TaxID=37653 RepID=A0A0L8GL10_OCTBM
MSRRFFNGSGSARYQRLSKSDDGFVDMQYSDRTWPLLILGALMFIPGSYHVMIAYYAYKGYEGYSFEDIPDFD